MNWLPRKRALVPVDFSDKSFTAVDVARDLVEQAADIHVVHVLQELSAMEPSEVWRTIDEETRIRHATKALIDRLEEDGAGDVSASVFVGDPARRLATLASEENFDLIVLTSHGRTGFQRLMLGSVAERLVRLAHCPVIVLRD